MKGLTLLTLMLVAAITVKAQNGTTFISLRGGWVTAKAYTATVSYDWSTRYFNQNEVYLEYYKSYKVDSIQSYMAGFVLKPVLFRAENTAVRLRLGAGVGTTIKKFLIAPQFGFELSESLGHGVDFLLLNRNQYVFMGKLPERWRVGFEIGIRFPLN